MLCAWLTRTKIPFGATRDRVPITKTILEQLPDVPEGDVLGIVPQVMQLVLNIREVGNLSCTKSRLMRNIELVG